MTWEQWVNSSYNDYGCSITDTGGVQTSYISAEKSDATLVNKDDIIINNGSYRVEGRFICTGGIS